MVKIMSLKNSKKGVSQIQGIMITLGILLLLTIIIFVFLGDSTSGIKALIKNIFG